MTENDDILVQRLRNDDEEAFRMIFDRYHPMLLAISYKMLKDNDVANGLVQNVFVKLWESRKGLNISTSLKGYLIYMEKNSILNYIRNYNNRLAINYRIAQMEETECAEPSGGMEQREIYGLLGTAIDRLPQRKKDVINLRQAGFTNPEIAKKLNISVNTVRVHYQEGLKMLKDNIGKLLLILLTITQL